MRPGARLVGIQLTHAATCPLARGVDEVCDEPYNVDDALFEADLASMAEKASLVPSEAGAGERTNTAPNAPLSLPEDVVGREVAWTLRKLVTIEYGLVADLRAPAICQRQVLEAPIAQIAGDLL